MFGLFAPACPAETAEKAWVERRLRWLADRLGHDRMRGAPAVTPTDAFFPDPYRPDEAGARACLDRVCGYMGVDHRLLILTVLPDEEMPGAAGLYERRGPRGRARVWVAASQLADPASLLATLAHEVAHEVLLGGGVLTADVPDHEPLTDLATVFLGLGVFPANATLRESHWNYGGTYSGWSIGRQGYLSAVAFGYALAVWAYVRGEADPAWAAHLRPDARGAVRKGLRYLAKTGDSVFRPDTPPVPRPPPTAAELVDALAHRSPSFRLAALADLGWAGADGPELVAAVGRCLRDPDGAVRAEAARGLAGFGEAAGAAVPRLFEMVQGGDDAWPSALSTLAALRADPARVVPEVARLLAARPESAGALAAAVRAYGADAGPAVPALLDAFGRQLAGGEVREVVAAVRALVPDPEARVRAHFAADPELVRHALWELRQPVV